MPDRDQQEDERILAMSDEEIMAEHLALYGGDERLAKKSIDMQRARFEKLLGERYKH
jgi:hypothetical protein